MKASTWLRQNVSVRIVLDDDERIIVEQPMRDGPPKRYSVGGFRLDVDAEAPDPHDRWALSQLDVRQVNKDGSLRAGPSSRFGGPPVRYADLPQPVRDLIAAEYAAAVADARPLVTELPR